MIKHLTIPLRVPSSNKWTFGSRFAYTEHRDQWYKAIGSILGKRDSPAHPYVQAVLISERNRILDYQNLVGGAKPIPDALKHLGWIVDDDPTHWSCVYIQSKVARKDEQTTLLLMEDYQ